MTPKLTEQLGKTDKPTIIVGDFNILLSEMDRSSKQEIRKHTAELNNTINQLNIIDIYRILHPRIVDYTFFSSSHGRNIHLRQTLTNNHTLSALRSQWT